MNTGKLQIVATPPGESPQLLQRCQVGEREALGEFYRLFRPEVVRNLHRVLGPGRGDLEDVLQDVFIEAFRSIGRFRGDAKLSTWLYRVCVNVALQRLRKRKRLAEIPDEDVPESTGDDTPERGLDARRRLNAVYNILDRLSPKKRVVFILHEIEGREPKEIAEIVGAPVLTVRTRLHYARKEFYNYVAREPRLDGGARMSHVRPVELADLLRGRLAEKQAARARAHLDGCVDCRAAYARVRASNEAFDDLLAAPLPEVGVIRGEATVRWMRLAPAVQVRKPFFAALAFATAAAAFLAFWNPAPRLPSLTGPLVVRLTVPSAAHEKPLEAVVTLLGGVVNLTHGGATARLQPSMKLSRGDLLGSTPEARVAAQWAEGSGFLLLGDSQLAIDRLAPREVRLVLARGKVDVRRGPHGPDDALQVVAPAHVVRARGTWFTVAAAQYQTTVEVLEGVVEVTDREGGASTTLHAPTRAVFGRGRVTEVPMVAHDAAALRTGSEMNLLSPAGLEANALMTVSSDPAGTLAVDGVELGPTPLMARQPLGRHYIEIARHGFQPLRRWVTLGPETGEVRVALVKAAELNADSQSVPVEIESMIRARGSQIRGCYERRLKRDPTLAGTVSLRLKVGDAGQVRLVSVEESTLDDPMVAECLRKEALGWSFKQGRNATVVYPFVFRAQ